MLAAVTGPGENPYTVVRRRDIGYYKDVQLAIQSAFAGADEDDISLFFIASHGDRSSQNMHAGEVLLAGPQGERDYITMAELAQFLGGVPGRVVVILESCGSGAAIYDGGAITSRAPPTPSATPPSAPLPPRTRRLPWRMKSSSLTKTARSLTRPSPPVPASSAKASSMC